MQTRFFQARFARTPLNSDSERYTQTELQAQASAAAAAREYREKYPLSSASSREILDV
jgi:hypothetical protein